MTEPPAVFGLVRAPDALAQATAAWVTALRAAAGPEFRAAYMHGSALTSRFDPHASDVNLLIVVAALAFPRLESLAQAVRELAASGKKPPRIAPLVLTEAQVRGSADVFPAEFLDLSMRRALLAGEDVLADLVVQRNNLRHQCEYELRSKLVGLRQAYLLNGGAADLAHPLLARAAGGLGAVLRSLLILRDEPVPEDAGALVDAVAGVYGVQAAALRAPFEAHAEIMPPPADVARSRLATHLGALEILVAAVDALPGR